jgi:hypothetical protein
MDDSLQKGIAAFKAGNHQEARKFFLLALEQNVGDERIWKWNYNVAKDDSERIQYLTQILRINPKNKKAYELLNNLMDDSIMKSNVAIAQNNSVNDFLEQIDRAKKEREVSEQAKRSYHRQKAQYLFNEAKKIIDSYLDALGKRQFGIGNYEIKHAFKENNDAKFWVEDNKSWSTTWIENKPYKVKLGFEIGLEYSWIKEDYELGILIDDRILTFSEYTLRKYIALLYQLGPRTVRWASEEELNKLNENNSSSIDKSDERGENPIHRTTVNSSNLNSIGYDVKTKTLDIQFNNGVVYRYYLVPQEIYVGLMKAESHGKYFHVMIRNRFQYNQVSSDEPIQKSFSSDDDENDFDCGEDEFDDEIFGQWVDTGNEWYSYDDD